MSEFGPSPAQLEEQGVVMAREITTLRAQAKTDADYEAVIGKVRELKALFGVPLPESTVEGSGVDPIEAERIMGEDQFFGAAAVEKTFGLKLEASRLPALPFSREALETAKKLGQMLILRADQAPDGQPLTMQKMQALLQPVFDTEEKGQVLYGDWYHAEDFYTKETPALSWALVSKEVIPDSTDKTYLEQTDRLVEYLETEVFQGEVMPELYQEAIREFKAQRATIEPLIDSDWQSAAQMLVDLKLSQLTRQKPAEALYDVLVALQAGGERLLEDMYTFTSRRESVGGRLVSFGSFGDEGALVGGWRPDGSGSLVGVVFSRSH